MEIVHYTLLIRTICKTYGILNHHLESKVELTHMIAQPHP